MSPPARGAWIEIKNIMEIAILASESPPARGAWIEIRLVYTSEQQDVVAPRTGGVD